MSLFTLTRNDRTLSFSRKGVVGGLRSSQIQGHIAAYLAAATDGAGESAAEQLPEPQSEYMLQPVRQPSCGDTRQNQTRGKRL